MNLNTANKQQLELLEIQLQEWLNLHKNTGVDTLTESKYQKLLLLIQQLFTTQQEGGGIFDSLIDASNIASSIIKNQLKATVAHFEEGRRQEVVDCIAAIAAFEKRTDLKQKQTNDPINDSDHIRIVLKKLKDEDNIITSQNLKDAYAEYYKGDLDLGPELMTEASSASGGYQLVINLGEHFKNALTKKGDLEEKAKVVEDENKKSLPIIVMPPELAGPKIIISFSKKKAFVDELYNNNTKKVFFDFLSNSGAYNTFTKSVSSTISAASLVGDLGDALGPFKCSAKLSFLSVKRDFASFSLNDYTSLTKIGLASLTFTLGSNANYLTSLFPPDFPMLSIISHLSIKGQIIIRINLDVVECIKRKLIEEGKEEIIDDIKKIELKGKQVEQAAEELGEEIGNLEARQERLTKKERDLNKIKNDKKIKIEESKIFEQEERLTEHKQKTDLQKKRVMNAQKKFKTEYIELDKLIEETNNKYKGTKYGKSVKYTTKLARNKVIRKTSSSFLRGALRYSPARFMPLINFGFMVWDLMDVFNEFQTLWDNRWQKYGNITYQKEKERARRKESARASRSNITSGSSSIKKYVEMAMYLHLPKFDKDDNSTTLAGAQGFPVYLRFYENSDTYKDYISNKGKYSDRNPSESVSSRKISEGELISFSYIDIDRANIGISMDKINDVGRLDLSSRDKSNFKLHYDYEYLMDREGLLNNKSLIDSSDYVEK